MDDYELIDNKEKKQYEFRVDNYVAKIEYMKSKNGDIYLTHTEVPAAIEGRGIATRLVEKTLKDIDSQKLKVVPMCGFVASYIRRHPQWHHIVMEGINVG